MLPANQPVNTQTQRAAIAARLGGFVRLISAPLQGLQQIQHAPPSCPSVRGQDAAQSSRDEDLDKDSGSKVILFTPFHQCPTHFPHMIRQEKYNSVSDSKLNGRN